MKKTKLKKIEFTDMQWQYIFDVLSTKPYIEVAAIIITLQEQFIKQ